jgi:hypothetical protein
VASATASFTVTDSFIERISLGCDSCLFEIGAGKHDRGGSLRVDDVMRQP